MTDRSFVRSREPDIPKVEFYHYTDSNGSLRITGQLFIKASVSGRGTTPFDFPAGAYLTDLPPTLSKREIAAHIWFDNIGERMVQEGRVDYVIIITINPDKLDLVKMVDPEVADPEHRIFYFPGDLGLNDESVVVEWKVREVGSVTEEDPNSVRSTWIESGLVTDSVSGSDDDRFRLP